MGKTASIHQRCWDVVYRRPSRYPIIQARLRLFPVSRRNTRMRWAAMPSRMYFVNCGRTLTSISFIINTRRALNLCAFVIAAIRSTATLANGGVATRSSPEAIWDLPYAKGMIVKTTGVAVANFNEFRPEIAQISEKGSDDRTRCATNCRSAIRVSCRRQPPFWIEPESGKSNHNLCDL